MAKKQYKIKNMNCVSCALLIEGELEDAGIKCRCSFAKQTLEVEGEHKQEKIKELVKQAGYELI